MYSMSSFTFRTEPLNGVQKSFRAHVACEILHCPGGDGEEGGEGREETWGVCVPRGFSQSSTAIDTVGLFI